MANNSTIALPGEGVAITGNLTILESISQLPLVVWKHRDLFILETKIVAAAMGCIYLGAHASLRRPHSASPPKKKNSKSGSSEKDDDKDDHFVQGLVASDAIMFPILAGTVLVGLYYLIKWLEDPAIISKIMGIYFSLTSLGSMGTFFADALHFVTGFVFPDVWKGDGGKLYHFDSAKKCQYTLNEAGERVYDETKQSPFPGLLAGIGLSNKRRDSSWQFRHLFQEQWTVRIGMRGFGKGKIHVKLMDVLGVVLATGASILYQTTNSNFLSNVTGYAFCYFGMTSLSPTTFNIGSSVLVGLFFYDIYMVFYTPYMVTVATKLDVPIKLVFESNKRSSMLGLGDIVVPGLFIGLCLRFDHYMYYYRQWKTTPVELETEISSDEGTVATREIQHIVTKPAYVNPMGQWGNRFWGQSNATPSVKAAAFPKPYFKAAMVGYLLSMTATLVMLLVFQQAQPALLYLVPGVTSAVWATGFARGEIQAMWNFTEDGSLDTEDAIVEVDRDGKIVKEIEAPKKDAAKDDEAEKKQSDKVKPDSTAVGADQDETKASEVTKSKNKASRTVFVFSIESPPSAAELEEEQ